MSRSWRDFSPAEIDAGVERQHERALLKWELEQDRLDAEVEYLESIRPDAEESEAA